uniref:Histidine phosphatase family protein n=1 Tax=Globodera pallida TaxID=36090 RepID=A0A183CMR6_GLOPA
MFHKPLIVLVVCLSSHATQIFGVSPELAQSSDSEKKHWIMPLSDGMRFVHCQDVYSRTMPQSDEQVQLKWIVTQKHCFGDVAKHFTAPNRYFRQLRDKINAWNAKLVKAKSAVLKIGSGAACPSSSETCVIQNLERQGKTFDLSRYENKMSSLAADLESINLQLEEKFKYFLDKVNAKNDTSYRIDYTFKDHSDIIKNIKEELAKVKLDWTRESDGFWTTDMRPVVRQTIWLVRHAQREDNVDENWCKDKDELAKQDSPLSEKGIRQQSEELAKMFANIKVDRLFASPFKRCLETAHGLIGGEEGGRGVFINVEPGLSEFHGISNIHVGFDEPSDSHQFPLIDPNYWPVFNKRALVTMEIERRQRKRDANDHDFVTLKTIRHILERNSNAENIVLVSHMSNIGLLLELLGAEWAAVGQATVSKLVKYEENVGHNLDVLKQFRVEYVSSVMHLSERTDVHAH